MSEKINKKNKKKAGGFIVLGVVLILVVSLGLIGINGYNQAKTLKRQASGLKTDLKTVIACISQNDLDGADQAIQTMDRNVEQVQSILAKPLWKIAAKFPVVGQEVRSATTLVGVLADASDSIMKPAVALLRDNPLSDLKTEEGFNTEIIDRYIAFYEAVMPKLEAMTESMSSVELSIVDPDGKLMAYVQEFVTLAELLKEASSTVLDPLVAQLKQYPIDSLKTEEGFNNEGLKSYLIFLEDMIPSMQELASKAENVALPTLDAEGKFTKLFVQLGTLAGLLQEASQDVIDPLLGQLEEYPLDLLKTEEGFNVRIMSGYLDFLDGFIPDLQNLTSAVGEADLGALDAGGMLTSFLNQFDELVVTYEENKELIPLIRTIFGDGSDRFYVVAPQNTTEIRAGGGFPGSIGSLRVEDGILKIGEFSRVYDNFGYAVPTSVAVTDDEYRIFGEEMTRSWDATYCPDFERAGEIWAATYGNRNRVKVDGVISMTPAVIQDLLSVYGAVTLSDGTELDGTNATRILQHDLYYSYHGRENYQSDEVLDTLFAETAKLTMAKMVSGFSVKQLTQLLEIFKEDVAKRTIMLWFDDDQEQQLCSDLGCSGGLSKDPANPVAGVYFNGVVASKMGWFVNIDIECGESRANGDGSSSYDVQVTYSNCITDEEYYAGSGYITGGIGKGIHGNVHLFAPMGGTISDIHTNTGITLREDEYAGLQLFYASYIVIEPDEPLVVTYTVTTSPRALTPLEFSVTPTMQDYRG